MSEWICIYTAENALQAHCIKGMLAQKGIESLLQGEHLAGAIGELAVDRTQVTISVYPTQVGRAKEYLVEFEGSASNQDWLCPSCGESNCGSFEICWACSADPEIERSA